jgi:hypothetical protein
MIKHASRKKKSSIVKTWQGTASRERVNSASRLRSPLIILVLTFHMISQETSSAQNTAKCVLCKSSPEAKKRFVQIFSRSKKACRQTSRLRNATNLSRPHVRERKRTGTVSPSERRRQASSPGHMSSLGKDAMATRSLADYMKSRFS